MLPREWVAARTGIEAGGRRAFAAALALATAAAPVALNGGPWIAGGAPDATLALDAGRALLGSAPAGAVLLTAGDLDSYPLWYLQAVHGLRRDVTVVIVPMLPAGWYRAELARRWSLLDPDPRWLGQGPTLAGIGAAARGEGRPLVASALVPRAARQAAAPAWSWGGSLQVAAGGATAAHPAGVDTALARRTATLAAAQIVAWRQGPPSDDPAARLTRRLLACADAALVAGGAAVAPAGAVARCAGDGFRWVARPRPDPVSGPRPDAGPVTCFVV